MRPKAKRLTEGCWRCVKCGTAFHASYGMVCESGRCISCLEIDYIAQKHGSRWQTAAYHATSVMERVLKHKI